MSLAATTAMVIGGEGQVGGALLEALGDRPVVVTQRRWPAEPGYLDLASAARCVPALQPDMESHGVGVVFIAAGMAWVDGCEQHPDRAYAVNRDGAATVARMAREVGARSVYYSTEYVFDGRGGPYPEEAAPNPISVYGKSKLAGEAAVMAADPDALVVRTTVVYGPEEQGKNFAYQLAQRLVAGEAVVVPEDQVSSPTYNRDLAAISVALVEAGARGIYNIVGPETMDRFTFARRLARAAGLDPGPIRAVATAALNQVAPRPLATGLTIDKMLGTLSGAGHCPRPRAVEEAVAHWQQHPRGRPWPS